MATTKISWAKAYRMSDDELRVLSMEKGKRGNASAAALMAQQVLLTRSGHVGIRAHSDDGWVNPGFTPLSDEYREE